MSQYRSDALTGELFNTSTLKPAPATPGSMDFRKRFASLAADAISGYRGKDSDSSKRYFVAARMSELAEVDTSKALLDSYTAPSREECNLPAWKIPCFEVATNSRLFTEFLASFHGGRVLWGDQIIDADVGSVERQIAELQEQRKRLKQFQQQRRGRR